MSADQDQAQQAADELIAGILKLIDDRLTPVQVVSVISELVGRMSVLIVRAGYSKGQVEGLILDSITSGFQRFSEFLSQTGKH